METYIADVVSEIRKWYGALLYQYDSTTTIKEFFTLLSNRLWEAYELNNPVICNQINNYHPNYIGKSWDQIRKEGFSKKDAEDTIAYEHSFAGMIQVPNAYMDADFESAVNTLLDGDLMKIEMNMQSNPSLITRRSQYGHKATLLHYLGNNGVELYRQVIPGNTIALLQALVNYGADINATMKVYGGNFTMIDLFKTSIHPIDAGIKEAFLEAFGNIENNV